MMQHTLVQDVQSAIDRAARKVEDIRDGSVNDIDDNIRNVENALEDVEAELSYVDSEMDDLQGFKDEAEGYGLEDADDLESTFNELEKLREEAEFVRSDKEGIEKIISERDKAMIKVRNLQFFRENQRLIIEALLKRLRNVAANVNEDEIGRLLEQAVQQNRLDGPQS